MNQIPLGDPIAVGTYQGGATNGDKIQTARGCTFVKEGIGLLSVLVNSPDTAIVTDDVLFVVVPGVNADTGLDPIFRAVPGGRSVYNLNDFSINSYNEDGDLTDGPVNFLMWRIPREK